MPTYPSILLIDDSPGECELFRLGLVQTGVDAALYTEHDAEAALHFLYNHSDLPSFVLLDWHLGKQCGDDFLRRLRANSRLASIPVVVLTTSDAWTDIVHSYAHGANGYVMKPGTFDELIQCIGDICRYWLRWNLSPVVTLSHR